MAKHKRIAQDKQRALTLLHIGHMDEALELLCSVTDRDPSDTEAWHRLGGIYWERGDGPHAEECFRKVVKQRPDLFYGHYSLALALEQQDRLSEAIECYRRAIRLKPDFIEAIHNAAIILGQEGRFEEAHELLAAGLAARPSHSKLIAVQAEVYERQGDHAKAYETLQPLLADDVTPTAGAALTFARFCKTAEQRERAVAMHEALLARPDEAVSREERVRLHFSLGRLLDRAGDYDRAFEHFRSGNIMKGAVFNTQALIDRYAALRRVYTRLFLEQAPRSSRPSSQLTFIVGMPRSGTTLVEQILASHPAVAGMGEAMWLPDLVSAIPAALGGAAPYPDCMAGAGAAQMNALADRYLAQVPALSPGVERVTDKMLQNFEHLGLIALLFPEARVIHCRRHPLDTCLSSYFILFRSQSFRQAYDLGNLGVYYREYRRLMDHWKAVVDLPLLEIDYETLVDDQERITRDLLAFCGLPWHEDCLRFHETRRAVGTASYDQVRRPLYRSSVARWRHYDRHLGPLREALGDLAD